MLTRTFSWSSLLLLFACSSLPPSERIDVDSSFGTALTWQIDTLFELDSIAPIGLVAYNGALWLSDGDHNRLATWQPSTQTTVQVLDGFERPMHLDADENQLYIPEYGNDVISLLTPGQATTSLPIGTSLDAPAGISVRGTRVAIADFYNHRILVYNGTEWKTWGSKGDALGQLHYPTDVQWTDSHLYIADAYNHRVQVWDLEGNPLYEFGKNERINAATGLYVMGDYVWVTDFEHHRLLLYTTKGALKTTITEGLNKPTDVLLHNDQVYITNYGSHSLLRLALR